MAAVKIAEMQKSMESDVNEIKKIETEYTKVFQAKQTLIEKKSENELVMQEFNMLEEGASVYKLVGPVLAKQDLTEAKSNVSKRVEYIAKEITRMENLENDFQNKVEEKRKNIMKLQEDYRKIVMQAQQAASQQTKQ